MQDTFKALGQGFGQGFVKSAKKDGLTPEQLAGALLGQLVCYFFLRRNGLPKFLAWTVSGVAANQTVLREAARNERASRITNG